MKRFGWVALVTVALALATPAGAQQGVDTAIARSRTKIFSFTLACFFSKSIC